MADMKVSAAAQTTPVSETQPQKAENAVSKFAKGLKNAIFGKVGSSVLAGAATGALLAGPAWPVGAAIGAAAGLGIGAAANAANEGKKGLSALNAAAAGGLLAAGFGLPGLLVGGTAYLFATGKAQEAATSLGNTLGRVFNVGQDKAEPAPAQ